MIGGEGHTRRLFAADCAEAALLGERASGREPDARSWAAVTVARKFAEGNATEEELTTARDAAAAAAWDITRKPPETRHAFAAACAAAASVHHDLNTDTMFAPAWDSATSAAAAAAGGSSTDPAGIAAREQLYAMFPDRLAGTLAKIAHLYEATR